MITKEDKDEEDDVVEKDAVFIPAGWDNNKKIAILYENMHRWG